MRKSEPGNFTPGELAAIFGVHKNTVVSKWQHCDGFPKANADGRLQGIAVARWWLQHKAPKSQRAVPAEEWSVIEAQRSLDHEAKRLDLRLKSHKVAMAIGGDVRFDDIRDIVSGLQGDIREACQKIYTFTGQDVGPLFDEAFELFDQRLNSEQKARQETGT